jgi:NADH:ubiquinone oxidoreductase subunit C
MQLVKISKLIERLGANILVSLILFRAFYIHFKKSIIDYFVERELFENEKFFYLFLNIHLFFSILKIIIIPFFKRVGIYITSFVKVIIGSVWLEREVWDMGGLVFVGHKYFRRILNDYGFSGFTLRRDFSLTGYLEQRYYDILNLCCYFGISMSQVLRNFLKINPWQSVVLTYEI